MRKKDPDPVMQKYIETLEEGYFFYIREGLNLAKIELKKIYDEKILEIRDNRDKKQYEIKNIKKRSIKTLVGVIEIDCYCYYDKIKKQHTFLFFDEIAAIGTYIKGMTDSLVEKIIDLNITKNQSYGDVARLLNNMGMPMTRQNVKNIVDKYKKHTGSVELDTE